MKSILFSFIAVLCCFFSFESAVARNKSNANRKSEQWTFQVVDEFSDMPSFLLDSMHLMGRDQSLVLNEYEGQFMNRYFGIDSEENSLVGKKVAFLLPVIGTGKMMFFSDFRKYYADKSLFIHGVWLYRFNSEDQSLYGDYDALVIYWFKGIVFPTINAYRKELREYEKYYPKPKKKTKNTRYYILI